MQKSRNYSLKNPNHSSTLNCFPFRFISFPFFFFLSFFSCWFLNLIHSVFLNEIKRFHLTLVPLRFCFFLFFTLCCLVLFCLVWSCAFYEQCLEHVVPFDLCLCPIALIIISVCVYGFFCISLRLHVFILHLCDLIILCMNAFGGRMVTCFGAFFPPDLFSRLQISTWMAKRLY